MFLSILEAYKSYMKSIERLIPIATIVSQLLVNRSTKIRRRKEKRNKNKTQAHKKKQKEMERDRYSRRQQRWQQYSHTHAQNTADSSSYPSTPVVEQIDKYGNKNSWKREKERERATTVTQKQDLAHEKERERWRRHSYKQNKHTWFIHAHEKVERKRDTTRKREGKLEGKILNGTCILFDDVCWDISNQLLYSSCRRWWFMIEFVSKKIVSKIFVIY